MIDVVISIKPKFVDLIKDGQKNYEFRKYIPKKGVDRLWIYTSSPICTLEYVAEIDNIVTYPKHIIEEGIGNDDFNNGLKQSKHAYHIKHLYRLKTPLKLERLRNEFSFTAPQSYFYLENNQKLSEFVLMRELERIF